MNVILTQLLSVFNQQKYIIINKYKIYKHVSLFNEFFFQKSTSSYTEIDYVSVRRLILLYFKQVFKHDKTNAREIEYTFIQSLLNSTQVSFKIKVSTYNISSNFMFKICRQDLNEYSCFRYLEKLYFFYERHSYVIKWSLCFRRLRAKKKKHVSFIHIFIQ